jgi:2-methylcitrate dehydratase PrpD
VFGTAAAAGGLHGLTTDRLQVALSLAGDHAAGLRRYQSGGSPANSALHAANAADWGTRCAQLAGAGFPAPPGMLDEVGGFLPTFGGEPDAAGLLVRDIESSWRIVEASIKAYPTCRSTQAPATAIDELRAEHGLKAEDVQHIEVSVSRHAFKCDRPDPRSELDAQFSIQYVLARLLVHGGLGPNDFGPSSRADAAVRALLPLIEVRCDETLLATHARVRVRLRGGGTLAREIPVGRVLGDPANPMSPEQIRRKFVTNARSRASAEQAGQLADFVLRADRRTPVAELTGLLCAAAGPGS